MLGDMEESKEFYEDFFNSKMWMSFLQRKYYPSNDDEFLDIFLFELLKSSGASRLDQKSGSVSSRESFMSNRGQQIFATDYNYASIEAADVIFNYSRKDVGYNVELVRDANLRASFVKMENTRANPSEETKEPLKEEQKLQTPLEEEEERGEEIGNMLISMIRSPSAFSEV